MKKYLLILIILIFVGCIKRQRNDNIVYSYNSITPEKLSFELETQTILQDGIFDPNVQDVLKINQLDKNATMQLLNIKSKVYSEHNNQPTSVFCWDDTLFHNTCRFFIYGRLDLQTNIKSFVIWEFDKDFDLNTFHSKSLWLLNLKEDRLCSMVLLATSYDTYIDQPPIESETYLKAGMFTATVKRTAYTSFWVDPVVAYHDHRGIDVYFTHYKVNENGFVEFVNDR